MQNSDVECLCIEHQQSIIVKNTNSNNEEVKLCYKCFTNHQLSDSAQQLIIDGLSKNLQILQQETSMSQKQLEKLSQLFISLQKQFNKRIMEILQNIENELESIKIKFNESIISMRDYIQSLTEQIIQEKIEELKLRSPRISEFNNQFKIQIFQQFLSLQKSQNQQIRLETIQEAKQQPLQNINHPLPTTKYQQSYFQNGINQCYALTMNYNERILACGDGSFIKIWNFNDQLENVQTLKGHTLWITCLSFSKTSNWFASGSADHSIRIWKELQNDNWECQQIIVGHKDQVQDILIASNDNYIITCSSDKFLKMWVKKDNIHQWECKQIIAQYSQNVSMVSLSLNSKQLAVLSETIQVWQYEQLFERWFFKQNFEKVCNNRKYSNICFISDYQIIVTIQNEGILCLFEQQRDGYFQTKTQIQFNCSEEQKFTHFPLLYNIYEKSVICISGNKSILYLHIQENKEFHIQQEIQGIFSAGYLSKNGKILIVAEQIKHEIQVWRDE